jgi:hypothetical protein
MPSVRPPLPRKAISGVLQEAGEVQLVLALLQIRNQVAIAISHWEKARLWLC